MLYPFRLAFYIIPDVFHFHKWSNEWICRRVIFRRNYQNSYFCENMILYYRYSANQSGHSDGNAVEIIHVVFLLDVTCLIDIFFIYDSIILSYQAENVDLIYKHLVIVFESDTHYFNWNMFKYVYIEKVYFRFKHCMPENEILFLYFYFSETKTLIA